jgi:hypothetical protein
MPTLLQESQMDPETYVAADYLTHARWASYRQIVVEVLSINPGQILEVGTGNRIIAGILSGLGFTAFTFDINPGTSPTVIGSASELPFCADAFDLVIVPQVLEHLPFKLFPSIIARLHSIARKAVIITLPHRGPSLTAACRIPFIGKWKATSVYLPALWRVRCRPEHCWEIGAHDRGVPERVLPLLYQAAGFEVEKSYRVPENPYHHFYVLKVED